MPYGLFWIIYKFIKKIKKNESKKILYKIVVLKVNINKFIFKQLSKFSVREKIKNNSQHFL
jgi:hypothetical protein